MRNVRYLKILLATLALFMLTTVTIGAYNVPRTSKSMIEHKTEALSAQEHLICIIGDPGTGAPLQYAVAREMRNAGCTDVRIVGDIIYPSGITDTTDPQLQTKFFSPYQVLFDHGITVSLLLGNHDYKSNELAWFELTEQAPYLRLPFYNYAEVYDDGICIISIDTTWVDKFYFTNRHIALIDWLGETLQQLSNNCRFSLALGHHPLKSSGRHGNATAVTRWFLQNFVAGHVDAYIAGHEHNLSDEGASNGTHLLVSGAGGKHTGADAPTSTTKFALDTGGFVALRFHTQENDDGHETVRADYSFHAVSVADDGEHSHAEIVWSGVIDGRGLRI